MLAVELNVPLQTHTHTDYSPVSNTWKINKFHIHITVNIGPNSLTSRIGADIKSKELGTAGQCSLCSLKLKHLQRWDWPLWGQLSCGRHDVVDTKVREWAVDKVAARGPVRFHTLQTKYTLYTLHGIQKTLQFLELSPWNVRSSKDQKMVYSVWHKLIADL